MKKAASQYSTRPPRASMNVAEPMALFLTRSGHDDDHDLDSPLIDSTLLQRIRDGFPVDAIKQVQQVLASVDVQPILNLIGMSMRTYQRRLKESQPLTPVESDRLYRLIKIEERATEVFQDRDIAADWLRTDNRALGDRPLNLLDTEIGVAMVERTLGRIEHGVFG